MFLHRLDCSTKGRDSFPILSFFQFSKFSQFPKSHPSFPFFRFKTVPSLFTFIWRENKKIDVVLEVFSGENAAFEEGFWRRLS